MRSVFYRATAALLMICCLITPAHALSVEQATQLIDEYYIDGLPQGATQAQSIEELLTLLGDQYTTYMTAEEYKEFLSAINDQELVGIGVSIQPHEKGIYISSVLEDSPALEAGLAAGDIILSADGVSIKTTEQATLALGGAEGSSVHIQVLKADGTTVELDLVRRKISVATTVQYVLSEDGNACVILCNSFGDKTALHFKEALQEHGEAVNAWIVDLSTNPGGTSSSASASAGLFIGSAIMVYMRDAADEYTYTFTLPHVKAMTEKPVIVLTSEHSASGSELFTAAVRDHAVGIAIGQRSQGKGVAQVMLDEESYPDLFDGDSLKVTAYRFFSPVGTTHDQGGVIPTLLIDPEYAYNAALLLCADEPEQFAGYLNITLCGYEFYIHLETALSADYRPAFIELLQALPSDAQLWIDEGKNRWMRWDMDKVVQHLGLSEYTPRTFRDVTGHQYADTIQTMATYRLINGYGDGSFRPDSYITRAEFCALAANTLGLTVTPGIECPFRDLSVRDWYYSPVMAMYQAGYISGYDDGFFAPNQTISQQEMVRILAKAAAWLNMRVYDREKQTPTEQELAPYANYSSWAQKSAWLLDSCGVDMEQVVPGEKATRAQAADLLCQLLVKINYIWPSASKDTDN